MTLPASALRPGRIRRRWRRAADRLGYWLVCHRHHRLAIAMWRALGMWGTGPGE